MSLTSEKAASQRHPDYTLKYRDGFWRLALHFFSWSSTSFSSSPQLYLKLHHLDYSSSGPTGSLDWISNFQGSFYPRRRADNLFPCCITTQYTRPVSGPEFPSSLDELKKLFPDLFPIVQRALDISFIYPCNYL